MRYQLRQAGKGHPILWHPAPGGPVAQGFGKVGSHPARSYPAAEKEEISSDLLSMEELRSTEPQKHLHSGDARPDYAKALPVAPVTAYGEGLGDGLVFVNVFPSAWNTKEAKAFGSVSEPRYC